MLIACLALIVAVATLAHTAPAPSVLEASPRYRSLWRVMPRPGQPPTVYLTFDDGPNARWTPPLLDVLRDSDVRATFFVIDRQITADTEAILRRTAAEGHTIGVHTGSRRLMMASPSRVARDVRQAAARITQITGRPTCAVFRPHAGWRSVTMYEGLREAGYTLVGWSWGMWDWHWWQQPDGASVAAGLPNVPPPATSSSSMTATTKIHMPTVGMPQTPSARWSHDCVTVASRSRRSARARAS